jgi:hypothetical protein
MRLAFALLALGLFAAAPAAGQTAAPAPETPANPWRELFTRWDGANQEAMQAEAGAPQQDASARPEANAIPAYSPLVSRSEGEAVALGRRVGEVVRTGNCAEGERIARQAGDFALVRAVRAHCRRSN